MGIRNILIAFACCCLIACGGGSSTDVGDATETAVGNDTIRADSTANPFPLLNYPPSWYFAIADSDTVTAIDTPVITYPYLNIHYRTFESVVREYGGPTFYREIVYRDGDATSEHARFYIEKCSASSGNVVSLGKYYRPRLVAMWL